MYEASVLVHYKRETKNIEVLELFATRSTNRTLLVAP